MRGRCSGQGARVTFWALLVRLTEGCRGAPEGVTGSSTGVKLVEDRNPCRGLATTPVISEKAAEA